MKATENISQLIGAFHSPRGPYEDWIEEVVSAFTPDEPGAKETLADLEHLLSYATDEQIDDIWNSAGGRILFSSPARTRLFFEMTLAALRRVQG